MNATEDLVPDLRHVVDCAAVCALAYNRWDDGKHEDCVIERSLRQPGALARPVVEDVFHRFEVKDRRHFSSGLDAKVFAEIGGSSILVAADGTDLMGRCGRELRGDLLNCLALVLGRSSTQVSDLVRLLEEVRRDHPGRLVVGTGHSLGGYVQQVVAARRPELLDRALVFNAPGVWPFSTDLRSCSRSRSSPIFSFSAIEPVAFLGRHLGRRAWLHGLFSHRITVTHAFLEGRWRQGYTLADSGTRLRLVRNSVTGEQRACAEAGQTVPFR